jgi:hypothetical protein
MNLESNRLFLGQSLEAIALCLIIAFRFINIEVTITLLVFNLLFLSLTLQLNETFNRKIGIIALGNVIGLAWNFVLHFSCLAGVSFFGEKFSILYVVFSPSLNFMWIVSLWSLSLAVLPRPKGRRELAGSAWSSHFEH